MLRREGIARRSVLGERRKPCDELKNVAEVQPRSGQRWHVECLAGVAGPIGAVGMFMEKRSARSKIKKRGKSQERQSAANARFPENSFPQIHLSTLQLSTLDGRPVQLVAS